MKANASDEDSDIELELKEANKQLKLSEARKVDAEIRSIENDLRLQKDSENSINWQEFIKIIGAVILGLGGVIAAFTQYEIAEVKAEKAELQIKAANMQLEQKKTAIADADTEIEQSESRKNLALNEAKMAEDAKLQAEIALNEYKSELEKLRSNVKEINPELVKDELVYIQFRGSLTRSTINELRQTLGSQGFNAPGAERHSGEYRSIIKYFSIQDSGTAELLKVETEKFFARKGCPIDIEVIIINSKIKPTPPLEIWLHHSCA